LLAGLVAGFVAGLPAGADEIGFGNGLPFFAAGARGFAEGASPLVCAVAPVCGLAAGAGLAPGLVSGFGSDAAA
jgi:hypothetical protein